MTPEQRDAVAAREHAKHRLTSRNDPRRSPDLQLSPGQPFPGIPGRTYIVRCVPGVADDPTEEVPMNARAKPEAHTPNVPFSPAEQALLTELRHMVHDGERWPILWPTLLTRTIAAGADRSRQGLKALEHARDVLAMRRVVEITSVPGFDAGARIKALRKGESWSSR